MSDNVAVDKWKRVYRVEIEDGNANTLQAWSFSSLTSLIEWAKNARLRRLVEVEEEL
jgi:hypothetical protein